MKTRCQITGQSLYEEQIVDARNVAREYMETDVSYNAYMIDPKTETAIPIKLYDKKKDSDYGTVAKFYTTHENHIPLGQLIYDTKAKQYWLCIESYDVDTIHYEGRLSLCMRMLKWQDEYGAIKETPIVLTTASKYNNGTHGTHTVVLGSDQLMVFMTMDTDTVLLDRGKKFFIDENTKNPTVYELTRLDSALFTYNGVGYLQAIMSECDYIPTELDLKYGVCEYKDTTVSPAPPLVTTQAIKATIYGRNNLTIGYSRKYSASFTDLSGNAVDGIEYDWNVSCEFKNKVLCNQEGNDFVVKVTDRILIGNKFKVQILRNDEVLTETEVIIEDTY